MLYEKILIFSLQSQNVRQIKIQLVALFRQRNVLCEYGRLNYNRKQESIPVGYEPPAWQTTCFTMNKCEHLLGEEVPVQ